MIRVTVEGITYPDYDDDNVPVSEAILLEKVSGLTVKEMWEGVKRFSGEPMKAFVWLVRRRAEGAECPRYSSFDFNLATFDMVNVGPDGEPMTYAEDVEQSADPTLPTED
jgi:hypothetical protein